MPWSKTQNLIGPQGVPGPAGEMGPAGASGPAGEPGPAGAACNTEFRVETGVPQFFLAAEGRWANLSVAGTRSSSDASGDVAPVGALGEFVIDPALEPRSVDPEG